MDNLLADLNKLDINDLLEVVESALTVIDAKTSKYKGVDLLELMELDDKCQVFSRLTRISNKAFRIEERCEDECVQHVHNKYSDVLNADTLCTFYDLKTWSDRIAVLEGVTDMQKESEK